MGLAIVSYVLFSFWCTVIVLEEPFNLLCWVDGVVVEHYFASCAKPFVAEDID